ncbi:uncharacterized protein LOC131955260 [Physella acuta]|uniref:uncharacterized protein LOC131955260 n=1 Tax=Physella acuta TaxID=109671 RepID=UPI0027DB1EFD|nr:uncharacterized protein LOC131955260 [Physella acuta]
MNPNSVTNISKHQLGDKTILNSADTLRSLRKKRIEFGYYCYNFKQRGFNVLMSSNRMDFIIVMNDGNMSKQKPRRVKLPYRGIGNEKIAFEIISLHREFQVNLNNVKILNYTSALDCYDSFKAVGIPNLDLYMT